MTTHPSTRVISPRRLPLDIGRICCVGRIPSWSKKWTHTWHRSMGTNLKLRVGNLMDDIDRRSALAIGLATAATLPALFTPIPALAQRYRPDEGRGIAPGVRRVDLTKRASEI